MKNNNMKSKWKEMSKKKFNNKQRIKMVNNYNNNKCRVNSKKAKIKILNNKNNNMMNSINNQINSLEMHKIINNYRMNNNKKSKVKANNNKMINKLNNKAKMKANKIYLRQMRRKMIKMLI